MARRWDEVDVWMAGLVLVWGTAFAAIRTLSQLMTPAALTWLRYLPFLLIFGAWLLLRRRDRLRALTGREWGQYMLVGALGVIGYHFPLYYGIQDNALGPGVTAATAAVLVATTPLWTLFFALVSRQEGLDGRKAVGSAIAFAGVVVVVLWGRGEAEFALARKAAFVLLAPLFWSLYNILGKPLVDRHGGLFFTGLSMCMGTLLLVPYGVRAGTAPIQGLAAADWWWLLYLSLAATVAGYAVWNFALKRRRPSEVTAYIYFIPVVATLAGWWIIGEAVTVWFVLGAALVLLGVMQVNQARIAESRRAAVLAENP